MAQIIQLRGDTSANWASVNPVLAEREIGIDTDTLAYKIGDGITNWNSLPFRDLAGSFENILLEGTTNPSIPDAGYIKFYASNISGRMLPKYMPPSGLDSALQPFLARNKIGYWCPSGNVATPPAILGFTTYTLVGTGTARNVATANLFQRMRRIGYVSSAVLGNFASARVAVAQVTIGGAGMGGFHKIIRFGCSDAAPVAGARQFVGIASNISAPTNVEPDTLTNSIGIGHGANDANMMLYWGGSAAQTPIDLGANFPINTLSADVYEFALFASPNNSDVCWEVTRLNTGHVASGKLTGTEGIQLPAPTTLLSYSRNWRTNNATAAAVAIDIMSDYIETDY